MPLFTFVVDYAGGTYVSQIERDDRNIAFQSWLLELLSKELAGGASLDIYSALSEPSVDELVPLNGSVGVWATSGTAAGYVVLLNVIQTAIVS